MKPFDIGIFVPVGQTLLIGSFGYRLLRSLKNDEELSEAFEALILSILFLAFFRQGAELLTRISSELIGVLERAGGGSSLIKQLGTAMETAQKEKFVSPEAMANAAVLRGGVWGILISISQLLFLCAEGFFHLAQKVFWNLILVLFPIAAGLFPAFPSMVRNLVLYALELSLWMPVLYLVNYCAGVAASAPEVAQAAFGLGVVITQLLAIYLILYVPSVTHRFMSGAFDHLLGVGGPAIRQLQSMSMAGIKKVAPTRKVGA